MKKLVLAVALALGSTAVLANPSHPSSTNTDSFKNTFTATDSFNDNSTTDNTNNSTHTRASVKADKGSAAALGGNATNDSNNSSSYSSSRSSWKSTTITKTTNINKIDSHLDGHVDGSRDAGARQWLRGRVSFAHGHQAGHFVFGEGDLLAAETGQGQVCYTEVECHAPESTPKPTATPGRS